MNQIGKRLSVLEEKLRPPEPLQALCQMPDGEKEWLPVSKIVGTDILWERTRGINWRDFDALLQEMRRRAFLGGGFD